MAVKHVNRLVNFLISMIGTTQQAYAIAQLIKLRKTAPIPLFLMFPEPHLAGAI
jgi:hypothetical protein